MTALKINLISLPMGSVLWKHKIHTHNTADLIYKRERESERECGRQRKNDEDLQSGKTRNGNKNHIFTGAWRLRRTSHLSTRRRLKDAGVEAGPGAGAGAELGVWAAGIETHVAGPNIRNYVFFINSGELLVSMSMSQPCGSASSIRGVRCAHALSI